ncbi:recombination regulator RecX [Anaerobacillus sp. MEB173]|uniref:recombination regulator RecX n=1 Tax=Anaerobacillus sp. MEB173 TaxID=3383345 RepID=UPI003F93515A
MILVTRITTQKRNQERFNVYIDRGNGEEYGFSVDQDVLISCQLKKGSNVDEAQLKVILYQDEIKKGFNAALNYLSYRMRTVKEIHSYLHKKEYSEAAINEVIKKLYEYKYVDDLEFAKAFVRTRKNTTVKGPEKIKQELKEKGVNQTHLEASLEQYSFEEQVQAAVTFLEKKTKMSRNQSINSLKQKLTRTLYGKGFSLEVIEKAFGYVDMSVDQETEWEVLVKEAEKAMRKYHQKYQGWELERRIRQYLYGKGYSFELIDKYISTIPDNN